MKFRYAVLVFALGAAAFMPQSQEPYPGQSSHAEPPKDWMCSNHPKAPAKHKCDCQKKCSKPTDESGNEIAGPLVIEEDPKCTVFCHKDHCACSLKCAET